MLIHASARFAATAAFALGLLACSGGDTTSGDSAGSGGGSPATAAATTSTGATGSSMSSAAGAGGASSAAGTGGGESELDAILAELRADPNAGMLDQSKKHGFPITLGAGMLFVSLDPTETAVAGDHDAWAGTALKADKGFSWVVIDVPQSEHYKFTDGQNFTSDPWSRQFTYDDYGEMSLAKTAGAHLERHFQVGDDKMAPRTVRVWVPDGAVTHELYAHDGQNLFDPAAIWGGWKLEDAAPAGMLIIGIDNTAARFDEYTGVSDVIDGQTAGGKADDYADYIEHTVRPLIRGMYGEPGPVGTLGSSLGGLVAMLIADRYPGEYAFAASMSGTMGWGSIGDGVHNQTVIQRYAARGHEAPILYVDSGGGGDTCADADGDGVDDDDTTDADNYCENMQFEQTLLSVGYTNQKDLFTWYEPGAQHDEADWAARVFRPLQVFAGL